MRDLATIKRDLRAVMASVEACGGDRVELNLTELSALLGGEEGLAWVSVKDRLPVNGAEVLIYPPLDALEFFNAEFRDFDADPATDVTHWLPLSAIPLPASAAPADEPEWFPSPAGALPPSLPNSTRVVVRPFGEPEKAPGYVGEFTWDNWEGEYRVVSEPETDVPADAQGMTQAEWEAKGEPELAVTDVPGEGEARPPSVFEQAMSTAPAILAAASTPSHRDGLREAQSTLIRIAADLTRAAPSDIAEDYPSGRRLHYVLEAIRVSDSRLKGAAVSIRKIADSLAPNPPAAEDAVMRFVRDAAEASCESTIDDEDCGTCVYCTARTVLTGGTPPEGACVDAPPAAGEALEKIDAAEAHLKKLCNGEARWTMRIPARPGRDSDLIFGDALHAARQALASQPASPEPRESADRDIMLEGYEALKSKRPEKAQRLALVDLRALFGPAYDEIERLRTALAASPESPDEPRPLQERAAAAAVGSAQYPESFRRVMRGEPSVAEPRESALREALTPSGATKAAYMGEFKFGIEDHDEDGHDVTREILVPWTTIKEIMAAIRDRAALAASPEPADELRERAEAMAREQWAIYDESRTRLEADRGPRILTRSEKGWHESQSTKAWYANRLFRALLDAPGGDKS